MTFGQGVIIGLALGVASTSIALVVWFRSAEWTIFNRVPRATRDASRARARHEPCTYAGIALAIDKDGNVTPSRSASQRRPSE